MFTCYGNLLGAPGSHQHVATTEAKRCYGLLPAGVATIPSAPARLTFGSRYNPTGPLSRAQYDFIRDLKGDLNRALRMSYEQASNYISELKGATMSTPTSRPVDPRLELLKGLIEMVPDGYYATQEYEGGHVEFIRVSSPKSGQYRDSRKFQTLHGSGLGARLELAAVLWPSNKWSVYKTGIVDYLLLLCTDYQGAAFRYAEKIGKCCRCNAELTDGRSRWLGIGPECEKHWPWVIENVLERKGPFTGMR